MKFITALSIFLLACLNAFAQADTIQFAKPEKLPAVVNSAAEESLPLMSPDGMKLYFSRTYHPQNTGGKWAGQDIWVSSLEEAKYQEASKLDAFNSKSNDVVVGVAKGGKRLYLLNVRGEKKGTTKAGISRSDFDETLMKWQEPEAVTIPELQVEGNFYGAYVGAQEDYILWTLPGNGMDTTNNIYVSTSPDGGESWTAPEAISSIATSLDDISPFYDEERKLLFWSTNGRTGQGGYDIYYARKLEDNWQAWSEPVNAGKAINSAGFDAYFFAASDGTAWFCSNKGDTLSNIYLSSVVVTPIEAEEVENEVPVDEVSAIVENEPFEKAPISRPMPDPVLIIDTKDGSSRDRSLSDLSLEELLDKDTHIRFVYFQYDKYNITAKYIEVLDDVGEILDRYPQLKVRIEGHTDNVGSQAYNMVLSENRAQSTKEYLLIHGIDDSRIKTTAFGKAEPFADNDTEDGRALNRRVELYFTERN